ncbi:MAG TPA: NAD-dependent epimerase/dehydratase family protein [Gemmatimonadales bacterium]|jgi:nucleoside-diphosphate-sugar epimerase
MNVLVTGATGFVGGHLVDRLLARGDAVTAIVRSPDRARGLAQRGVRLVAADLSGRAALGDAMGGQDVVYHAAALIGSPHEAEYMAVNRDGTANIAQAVAAVPSPPRVVLVSSIAAGGPSRRGLPKSAAGDDHPVTMYGRSKLAGERALADHVPSWCVIRAPAVYGPGDCDGFLPLFKAVGFGLGPTFGDGSMEVSLIHVDDLADALVVAGTAPALEHDIFYVSDPVITTGADVIRRIAALMHRRVIPLPLPEWLARAALTVTGKWAEVFGRKSILHPDKANEFYQDAWTGDPARFIAATGWKPAWDLDRGLADTLEWYRNARWI